MPESENAAPQSSQAETSSRGDFNHAAPQFRFEDLAKGSQRVLIQFGDAIYELKSTRNGRLVLNK